MEKIEDRQESCNTISVFATKGMKYCRIIADYDNLPSRVIVSMTSDADGEKWNGFVLNGVEKGETEDSFKENLRSAIIERLQCKTARCPAWFTKDWIANIRFLFNNTTVAVSI